MTKQVKETPEINQEYDVPFAPKENVDVSLAKTESLDEQLTKFKHLFGKKILYICITVMICIAIGDTIISFYRPAMENALLNNLFEVLKLIAMTVLGYIFGSSSQNQKH